MVQLEVEVEEGNWKPVIRYDCAHDFAHRDRYHVKGVQDKQEIALGYAESLDLADKDINYNWDIYQQRFLRGEFP
jgi:NH3-dependent NAD+ synthetase